MLLTLCARGRLRLLMWVIALILPWGLRAQTTPSCKQIGSLTTATNFTSLPNNNTNPICNVWALQWWSTGYSAITIELQGSDDNSTWTVFTGASTVYVGTNPASTLSGTIKIQATATNAWVRVNVTSVTGTGTVNFQLYGLTATISDLNPAGGGAAGSCGALGGDLNGTCAAATVVKVEGGVIPVSASLLGTNSSGQLIPAVNGVLSGNLTVGGNATIGNTVLESNAANIAATIAALPSTGGYVLVTSPGSLGSSTINVGSSTTPVGIFFSSTGTYTCSTTGTNPCFEVASHSTLFGVNRRSTIILSTNSSAPIVHMTSPTEDIDIRDIAFIGGLNAIKTIGISGSPDVPALRFQRISAQYQAGNAIEMTGLADDNLSDIFIANPGLSCLRVGVEMDSSIPTNEMSLVENFECVRPGTRGIYIEDDSSSPTMDNTAFRNFTIQAPAQDGFWMNMPMDGVTIERLQFYSPVGASSPNTYDAVHLVGSSSSSRVSEIVQPDSTNPRYSIFWDMGILSGGSSNVLDPMLIQNGATAGMFLRGQISTSYIPPTTTIDSGSTFLGFGSQVGVVLGGYSAQYNSFSTPGSYGIGFASQNTATGGGKIQFTHFATSAGTAVAGDTLIENDFGNIIISPNTGGKSIKLVGGAWTGPPVIIDANSFLNPAFCSFSLLPTSGGAKCYCTNCDPPTVIGVANACTSSGSQTGAIATGVGGTSYCGVQ